jgi:hypothetical protein
VVDDVDNLRRGDGMRSRGKREKRTEKFKHRFGVGGIVYVRMRLEGSTKVGGEFLGLLFYQIGPMSCHFFAEEGKQVDIELISLWWSTRIESEERWELYWLFLR